MITGTSRRSDPTFPTGDAVSRNSHQQIAMASDNSVAPKSSLRWLRRFCIDSGENSFCVDGNFWGVYRQTEILPT